MAWRASSSDLSDRALAMVENMNFAFLYDRQRQIFSIGYRSARRRGPGRLDTSYYDLLASEARLASFVAIAKGRCSRKPLVPPRPSAHQRQRRSDPAVLERHRVRVPDAAPHHALVLETLLDQSCRMAVRRQVEYGKQQGVPWGISESGFNVVDRHGNYQYKAFGVPGLGLKRGLGDELVVSPYATALAALMEPATATQNFRRLTRAGGEGVYGYYEAIDFTHRRLDQSAAELMTPVQRGTVVQAYLAHHQG